MNLIINFNKYLLRPCYMTGIRDEVIDKIDKKG